MRVTPEMHFQVKSDYGEGHIQGLHKISDTVLSRSCDMLYMFWLFWLDISGDISVTYCNLESM